MSEYLFGLGSGHLGKRAARAAEKHGATLVNYTDPECECGHGCELFSCPKSRRHWFAGPNRGEPFDSQLARTVLGMLKPRDPEKAFRRASRALDRTLRQNERLNEQLDSLITNSQDPRLECEGFLV